MWLESQVLQTVFEEQSEQPAGQLSTMQIFLVSVLRVVPVSHLLQVEGSEQTWHPAEQVLTPSIHFPPTKVKPVAQVVQVSAEEHEVQLAGQEAGV